MILAACLALMTAMALTLARLFMGPTLYDRVLAVNAFGTKTVVFLALFAFLIKRSDAIDIALLYALINFVGTIAILKFFRYRAFDLSLERVSAAPPAPGLEEDEAGAVGAVRVAGAEQGERS